jgi:hypothetical protein
LQENCDNAADLRNLVDSLIASCLSAATFERKDRLFPSDPKLFVTNPVSIAYGACGVAYAIKKITGDLPDSVLDWILSKDVNEKDYPPGLFIGMAGIAWSMLELGLTETAEEIFLRSKRHALLTVCSDVYYGIAGWGMACLKFYVATKKHQYLDMARWAGEEIVRRRISSDDECHWEAWNAGEIRLGFGHGASGVAAFLIYLSRAAGEELFLRVAEQGLRFDLRQGISYRRGRSWPMHVGAGASVVPYWRYGSAGIGTTLVRFLALSPESDLRAHLKDVASDTKRKYAIFPGKLFGLAGLCDIQLDLDDFAGPMGHSVSAAYVSSGISLFRIHREGLGTFFPGCDLWKLSCDYATGSAGIALTLHRLVTRCGPDFMLDELLPIGDGKDRESAERVFT